MKKIKIFPCPHIEMRIHVSDEMERDLKECKKLAAVAGGEGKDCDTCSWRQVDFLDTGLCELPVVREALTGGEKNVSETD